MFDLDVKLDGHFVKWTKNHLIKLQRERKLLPGVLQRVRRFKFSRHFFDDVIGRFRRILVTSRRVSVDSKLKLMSLARRLSINATGCLKRHLLVYVRVEVAGALKNVIAIAAGACTGLGFKANSLAALITRGLSELSRIGLAMGANNLTFIGLAGIGDLMLTCSSQKSRNFRVGYLLASDKTLEEAKQELGSVAEGIATAKAAYILAEKLGVRVSIVSAVYRVLYENCDLREAVNDLLTGSAKSELE